LAAAAGRRFDELDSGMHWSTTSGQGNRSNARNAYAIGEPPWRISDRLYQQADDLERRGQSGELSDSQMTGTLRHDQATRDRAAQHDADRLRRLAASLATVDGPRPPEAELKELARQHLSSRISGLEVQLHDSRRNANRGYQEDLLEDLRAELGRLGPVAPKPRKAASPDAARVDANLKTIGDTAAATQYLRDLKLSKAELSTLAKQLGVPVAANSSTASTVDAIVGQKVKWRLASKAIEGTSSKPGPPATAGKARAALGGRSDTAVSSSNATPKTEAQARQAVADAYAKFAARPNELVSLVKIRTAFGDMPREEQDRILKQMVREQLIQLDPDPNTKAIPKEGKDAAVRLGGEDKHFISIDRSRIERHKPDGPGEDAAITGDDTQDPDGSDK
jgi:hypothetical protein